MAASTGYGARFVLRSMVVRAALGYHPGCERE